MKTVMEKPTMGTTLLGYVNISFGLVALLLAMMSISVSIPLTVLLCFKALLGFISGVGLLYVEFWGWLLAVIVCIISLIEFALHPTIALPLELVVLPYLVMKRRDFRRSKE